MTRLLTDYVSGGIGRHISQGVLSTPVEFRSTAPGRRHRLRPYPIDIAFIGAPAADCRGNCTGKLGNAACGSLGYAIPDATYAKQVIVLTDTLLPLSPAGLVHLRKPGGLCGTGGGHWRPQGHPLRYHPDHPGPGGPGYGRHRRQGSSRPQACCRRASPSRPAVAPLAAAASLKEIMPGSTSTAASPWAASPATWWRCSVPGASASSWTCNALTWTPWPPSGRSPAPGNFRQPLCRSRRPGRRGGQSGRGHPGRHGN